MLPGGSVRTISASGAQLSLLPGASYAAELLEFPPLADVEREWSQNVGGARPVVFNPRRSTGQEIPALDKVFDPIEGHPSRGS